MIVHLIDGTYELFRHFYGLRRFTKGEDQPFGAVVGVLNGVLEMIEDGATHLGVATDHVIESFRNELWPGYKTGAGIEPALLAQFHPLEEALAAMGVAVWPMIELEADDALASAAQLADADDAGREGLDLDARQGPGAMRARRARACRSTARARRSAMRTACAQKFGVEPALIPDYLALVGDAADGYPGIAGIGPVDGSAAPEPARSPRGLSARGAGRAAARASLQDARDAKDRRGLVRDAQGAVLAGGRPAASLRARNAWERRVCWSAPAKLRALCSNPVRGPAPNPAFHLAVEFGGPQSTRSNGGADHRAT